jgi:hypothetical protein
MSKRSLVLNKIKEAWDTHGGNGLWWIQLSIDEAKLIDPEADFSDIQENEFPSLDMVDVQELLRREGLI